MTISAASNHMTSSVAVNLKIQEPKNGIQSQKTQGFCVAHFVTLADEKMSRSKILLLFSTVKRTLRSKI